MQKITCSFLNREYLVNEISYIKIFQNKYKYNSKNTHFVFYIYAHLIPYLFSPLYLKESPSALIL